MRLLQSAVAVPIVPIANFPIVAAYSIVAIAVEVPFAVALLDQLVRIVLPRVWPQRTSFWHIALFHVSNPRK